MPKLVGALFCLAAAATALQTPPMLRPAATTRPSVAPAAVCSRRSMLVVAASFGSMLAPPQTARADEADSTAAASRQPTTMTYDELCQLLVQCRDGGTDACPVAKVAFATASGEAADAVLKDGSRLAILGIPAENPSNDSSPYKLVAKLRDARVPYTFSFASDLAKYRGTSSAPSISLPSVGLPKLPSLPF